MSILLVCTFVSACKPVNPILATTTPYPPPVINIAAPPAETSTTTRIPTALPNPTYTARPETITGHPGWTTYAAMRSIKHMLVDQLGNLWAVGPDGAFVIQPDGSILHFTTDNGLPSNDLLSVGQDSSDAIWVGSNGSGAARYDGEKWQTYTTSDGLAGNIVFDIIRYYNAAGVLIGTDHGISWLVKDAEKWTSYTGTAFLPEDRVNSLIVLASDDMIWAATPRGVKLVETSQTFTPADGLASEVVNDIAVRPDCCVWAGTENGVSMYQAEIWTSYTTADGLVDNLVSTVAVSLFNVAWFGTPSGLSRFDGTGWTTYTTQDGLANDDVLSILIAPDETLWIGTAGGLSHFSPSQASQASETGQSTQVTAGTGLDTSLIYLKGGDLWTWNGEGKKQATHYGNITGFVQNGDKSRLAVFRRGEEDETSLWVMNLDGSQARLLVSQDDLDALGRFSETEESRETNSRVSFRGTTWVPGTNIIAYGTFRHIKYDGTIFHDDLNLVDAQTGENRILLSPGSGGGFTYSPDGSRLAIVGENDISIMNADGSDRHDKLLVYPTIHDVDYAYYPRPSWSADGQYLLLALPPERPMDDPTPPTTLWKIPADGSPAIQLGSINPSFTYAFSVAYTADQTHLAYWSMAFRDSGMIGEIHIANYDGTDDRVVIAADTSYFVSWALDGQHFVYYISSGGSEVWYISDQDGNSTQLPIQPVYISWVSNESFLYYDYLPCSGTELGLYTISGESQVIDRY